MKDYKEYMDNISVDAETHAKFVKSVKATPTQQHRTRIVLRYAGLAACAAVIALCIWGIPLLSGAPVSSTDPVEPATNISTEIPAISTDSTISKDPVVSPAPPAGDNTGTTDTNDTNPVQINAGALPAQQNKNAFTLLVYTYVPQEDGSVEMQEVAASDSKTIRFSVQPEALIKGPGSSYSTPHSYAFGETVDVEGLFFYYAPLTLLLNGQNITGAVITIDDGILASSDDEMTISQTIYRISPDASDTIIIGTDAVEQPVKLLFAQNSIEDAGTVPAEVNIHVTVTFSDGSTEEQTIIIDIARIITQLARYIQLARDAPAINAYYGSIPLADCELIKDSVKTVTEYYEYAEYLPDGVAQYLYQVYVYFDRNNYEAHVTCVEDGMYRVDWGDSLGSKDNRGYIIVVMQEDDGTLTGMIYRTPPRIVI